MRTALDIIEQLIILALIFLSYAVTYKTGYNLGRNDEKNKVNK